MLRWGVWGGYLRFVIDGIRTEDHVSGSPAETEALAAGLARQLVPGDVVLLQGELGSGKTVFVRGAVHELGFGGRVTSPTFAIGNVYPGEAGEIAHLDLYRLAELSVGDEAVVGDFLTPGRIAFVEWPHGELGEQERLRAVVRLEHRGDEQRSIAIDWIDRA